jgi:hypothetical protein
MVTSPELVLLDLDLLPGWVAEDDVEPAALPEEHLGERHREVDDLETLRDVVRDAGLDARESCDVELEGEADLAEAVRDDEVEHVPHRLDRSEGCRRRFLRLSDLVECGVGDGREAAEGFLGCLECCADGVVEQARLRA